MRRIIIAVVLGLSALSVWLGAALHKARELAAERDETYERVLSEVEEERTRVCWAVAEDYQRALVAAILDIETLTLFFVDYRIEGAATKRCLTPAQYEPFDSALTAIRQHMRYYRRGEAREVLEATVLLNSKYRQLGRL